METSFILFRRIIIVVLILLVTKQSLRAQNYEARSIIYNSLSGAVSGGIGALINKKQNEKWYKVLAKGFVSGAGGGFIVYGGKRLNHLIGDKQEPGYAWLSRAVFSAGNSIVENASSNIDFWKRWHFDIGFVRLELNTGPFNFTPRLMPSAFGSTIFMAANGNFNLHETLRSGTLVFLTPVIKYAPKFVASTPGNGILFTSGLGGTELYRTYAHEMVHVFQFQEFSGLNYFLKPLGTKAKERSAGFKKVSKWIYLDLNYEFMCLNYFLIQGGYKDSYSRNYLENEAEFLSVNHPIRK
jgi:hypothetical protein